LFCSKCGRETTENSVFCAGCGISIAEGQPATKRRLSTAAGIIDIVDGALKSVLVLVSILTIVYRLAEFEDHEHVPSRIVMTIVLAFLGILAIVGGICALRRKRWGWALAGAVGGVLPFFPLGIASLTLTVMAKDEFERKPTRQ
jgi:hypothetical protein